MRARCSVLTARLREDPLNMALVLFVERFLFGADYRKTVSPWLFSLVEDMEQFNSFL